jgi:hypothetical protein
MVHMLSLRTQPTLIAKVKAHANIHGNESADKLAKQGTKLPHRLPQAPHEHAYSTPYHLHKGTWPGMDQTPYKGPIRHLLPYITQYDKMHNLELIAQNFPNISKWTHDPNIDLDTSTNFGPILQLQIHNAHASSNFDITNIWAMLENNYSLAPPSSPKLLVPYGTLLNPTLGNTSYFHVHNNISMPYALNVIIKRFANFENSFYLAIIHDVLFL